MDNTTDNKNKNMWMVVGGLVVVALLIFAFANKKDVDDVAVTGDNTNSETAIDANDLTQAPEGVEDTSDTKTTGTSPAVSLSYQQALEKYKDKRIQFDNSCATTPKTVTYKDNTGIMLDNRSAQTRTIKIGSTYTVKGYGFKIVTLPDTYKQSKTILVDCDGQQNVATILVQE